MGNYILLGVLQGIFEWLPISSEGVVALASQFLIKEVNVIETALFLHLGTLLAVLIYFRKDWQQVLMLKEKDLLRFLVIATIFSLVIGFPVFQLVRNVTVGSSLLLLTGFGLLLTAYFNKKQRLFQIGFNKLAIVAGILQGLAVIPGLSRSGATIFGLSLANLKPSEILKISYMMSLPVVLASSIYLFLKSDTLIFDAWPALIFSFLVGFLSLNFLIKLATKINFFKFALIFAFLCFLGAGINFVLSFLI
jgi:undecaprenyl-diphosphatase